MSGVTVEASPGSPDELPQFQVDLGGLVERLIGRIKEKPTCDDQALKKEAMSTEQLSMLTFSLETLDESVTVTSAADLPSPGPSSSNETSIVSSSSSTASRESAYLSDVDGQSKVMMTPLRLIRNQSDAINQKVTLQTISRNGRVTQRWHTDPQSQRVFRMVTGCVPIVEGGKILLVSASRKSEWILPKGGWESDEVIEEGAIRECFEEAGVVGVLGPKLSEIDYETRKSKKRRLDQEAAQKSVKMLGEAYAVSPDRKVEIAVEECSTSTSVDRATEVAALVSNEEMSRIRGQAKSSDETCSVSSDASAGYSHVRMTLFPLYVSEVKSEWPENGRFRKAVDIDEAIRITSNRPEFQAALMEVKERNLHLPSRERTDS
jgi:NUDIX domain